MDQHDSMDSTIMSRRDTLSRQVGLQGEGIILERKDGKEDGRKILE